MDTKRKLNVHNTFRKRPGNLLNVLCSLNSRPESRAGKCRILKFVKCFRTEIKMLRLISIDDKFHRNLKKFG